MKRVTLNVPCTHAIVPRSDRTRADTVHSVPRYTGSTAGNGPSRCQVSNCSRGFHGNCGRIAPVFEVSQLSKPSKTVWTIGNVEIIGEFGRIWSNCPIVQLSEAKVISIGRVEKMKTVSTRQSEGNIEQIINK